MDSHEDSGHCALCVGLDCRYRFGSVTLNVPKSILNSIFNIIWIGVNSSSIPY